MTAVHQQLYQTTINPEKHTLTHTHTHGIRVVKVGCNDSIIKKKILNANFLPWVFQQKTDNTTVAVKMTLL